MAIILKEFAALVALSAFGAATLFWMDGLTFVAVIGG